MLIGSSASRQKMLICLRTYNGMVAIKNANFFKNQNLQWLHQDKKKNYLFKNLNDCIKTKKKLFV